MANLFGRIRNFKFPKKFEINTALSHFSKREWAFFSGLSIILLISTLGILESINLSFMEKVPARGGSISEGIIGVPRFVNPILAFSDTDKDLVALTYSGLMRKGADGTMIPDLAAQYTMTPDGLLYTFILKDNIYFHDGTPVTVDDVIFTINTVKNPFNKSPHKADWDGVVVEKVDDKTIQFALKQPYASFLENTALGIMSAKIWGLTPIELNDANTDPIGSGPFYVSGVSKKSSGSIDSYELSRFDKFSLGKPYLKKITLRFYSNEAELTKALEDKEVDQISSITPAGAQMLKEKGFRVESSVLPRVFGLFFNQNQNQIFTDKNVVTAIDLAIDKDRIIQEVLSGYGVAIDDPIPPNMIAYQKPAAEESTSRTESLQKAKDILTKDGWKIGSSGFLEKTTTVKKKSETAMLQFSISTGNAPELVESANLIQADLASIGINVDVKTFEVGNLNQSVIRPRKYDALLFGQIINHESDLFAFWHSSQRKDPGLNVAMYTNAKVDKILEDAFITVDEQARIKKYAQFEDEVRKDMPAIFLYSPDFLYVVSKDLQGLAVDHIVSPADRFLNSYLWYTEVDNVWKIFTPTP